MFRIVHIKFVEYLLIKYLPTLLSVFSGTLKILVNVERYSLEEFWRNVGIRFKTKWVVFTNFLEFAGNFFNHQLINCLIFPCFWNMSALLCKKLNQDHCLSPLLSQNSCTTNPYCKFSPFPWYYSDFIGFLLVFCFYFESLCLYDFGHFNFIHFFWAFPSKIN